MNPDDISQLDILNFLPDPVFAVNKDRRVIVWNRAMEILTGNSAKEVLGKGNFSTSLSIYGFNRPTLIDYILTEDPEIIRMYNHFSRNDDVVEAEVTYEKSGSEKRVLWGKASLLRSGNGDVIGAIETIRDISSQKQLECDLRDNEERYKSIFTNNHSVMLIINQESGAIIDANPYACRYYGYSYDDIVSANIADINQLTRDEVFREMNQAIIERRNFFEFKHKLASGEIRDVEVFSGPISIHSKKYLYSIVHDVTEKNIIRRRLAESEEQYRSLVETSRFGVIITQNMRIIYANQASLTILGIKSLDHAKSLLLSELVTQDSKKYLSILFDEKGEKDQSVSGFQILRPDGTIRTLEIRSAPISVKGEIYIQSSFFDVTEQKELEHAISLTNKKLNLMSNLIRHDVLNKLSALDISFDLLRDQSSQEVKNNILEVMRKSVEDLTHLMEFTRMYQDLGLNAPGWNSLDAIINHAKAFFSDKDSFPVIESQIPDIELFTDPLIEQVLYNLFENTARHGKGATKIVLSWVEHPESNLLLYEDDGIGIASEEKERIFERGYGKNTGFGLFLTREILSITHISIKEVGSSPGGVRFELTIPKTVCRNRMYAH